MTVTDRRESDDLMHYRRARRKCLMSHTKANPTNENTVNTSMKYPICSMLPHESCHPPIEVQTSAFAQGPPSNPWIRANSSGSETATQPRY